MSQQKEILLVLRIASLRETDLLVYFLSPHIGLITSSIRRGRQTTTQSSFPFQAGDFVEVVYTIPQNKDFASIHSVSPHIWRSRHNISYESLIFESYILELLYLSIKPNQENNNLFQFLLNQENRQYEKQLYLWLFLWHLLDQHGIRFDYTQCAQCHAPSYMVNDDLSLRFRKVTYHLDQFHGVLYCSLCQNTTNLISPAAIKLFYLSEQSNNWNALRKVPLNFLLQNIDSLCKYIHTILELSPKSFASLLKYK